MTLISDFAALIELARADELPAIRQKILDRVDEIGGRPAFDLLKQADARRLTLAEKRRSVDANEKEARDGG